MVPSLGLAAEGTLLLYFARLRKWDCWLEEAGGVLDRVSNRRRPRADTGRRIW